jgi:CubicO group peptidase (beta-lactamase class C family)
MTEALQQLLSRHVSAGTIPGAVAVLGSDDAEVVAVGLASIDGEPMRADAIMQIQSMTKPVTAVAALRLVEAGQLTLDESLERWLPELADRRVLSHPAADLDDTVPADRPITLRHLLTCTSGYGMVFGDSPLQRAMAENGTEAGAEPPALGADEWLGRLSELPLAFHPGEGWRYHHSYAVLGILLARVTERPLGDHLADDIFAPLGMVDTAFWVPEDKLDRLPAAYRLGDDGLIEIDPAGGGFYAGPPAFDVSHGELVSTAGDYLRFARMLADGGRANGTPMISAAHHALMTTDQVPEGSKAADSFFPGFWDETAWGFGLGITTSGDHVGRYGWSGGQGTDFFVDPDGTVGILLTQVELDPQVFAIAQELQALPPSQAR